MIQVARGHWRVGGVKSAASALRQASPPHAQRRTKPSQQQPPHSHPHSPNSKNPNCETQGETETVGSMASSKLMASSNSRNSDPPSPPSSKPHFTTTNFLPISDDSTLLDAQISLADAAPRTVDEVWREIVAGDRRECKEEALDEMMTLEDFLVKAGAVDDDEDDADDIKMPLPLAETLSGGGMFAVDPPFQGLESVEGSVIGFGNGVDVVEGGGRGKRGRPVLEQLDKAAQQRQRRMIKNRESAARSRERKQAYQVELESLAVKLEEENDKLLKEKAERKKERFKQLMEKVIPVVEKRRPPRLLRRIHSL